MEITIIWGSTDCSNTISHIIGIQYNSIILNSYIARRNTLIFTHVIVCTGISKLHTIISSITNSVNINIIVFNYRIGETIKIHTFSHTPSRTRVNVNLVICYIDIIRVRIPLRTPIRSINSQINTIRIHTSSIHLYIITYNINLINKTIGYNSHRGTRICIIISQIKVVSSNCNTFRVLVNNNSIFIIVNEGYSGNLNSVNLFSTISNGNCTVFNETFTLFTLDVNILAGNNFYVLIG